MAALAKERGFAVQRGAMVAELRPAGATKGDALKAFMTEPEFAGARPLFVGDDLTDEHGFAAAAALGGAGMLVGPARETRGALPARLGGRGAATGCARRHEQSRPLADRQLPGERAGRRRGRLRLGLPAAGRRRPALLRAARAARSAPTRGEWRIALEDQVSAAQRYLKNTPILVTRLTDADGAVADVYRFLPAASSGAGGCTGRSPSSASSARSPARRGSGSRSIRRATGARATRRADQRHQPHPLPHRAAAAAADHRRAGHPPARRPQLPARGHRSISSSAPTSPSSAMSSETLAVMLHQTADHWRAWVRGLAIPLEWQDVVIRAAITLKLCQHEETGAIVAALTTSIPEAPASRAQLGLSLLLDPRRLLHRPGAEPARRARRARRLSRPICATSSTRPGGGHIQPLYAVSGEAEARGTDRRGAWPAIAAWARSGSAMPPIAQVQHDAYGQIVLSNAQAFFDERLFRPATRRGFRVAGEGRRARLEDARQARRGPVGIPHPRQRPHLQRGDELGGLRPARQHRRGARPRRSAPRSGGGGRRRSARRSRREAW